MVFEFDMWIDDGKGGAVYVSISKLHAFGSSFENNTAGISGGGIYATNNATVVLYICAIQPRRWNWSLGHCAGSLFVRLCIGIIVYFQQNSATAMYIHTTA